MKHLELSLADFTRDHSFYAEVPLLLTIKSFDVQAIRKRYLESRSRLKSRAGSVSRRKIATGGLGFAVLKDGRINHHEVLLKLPEPRGIDARGNAIVFSSENKVISLQGENMAELENPWFSYIHTSFLNPTQPEKVLVSSSGFDAIFEFDLTTQQKTFEWFAWENGFDQGFDPELNDKVWLTRDLEVYKRHLAANRHTLLIDDPLQGSLPTAKRAAFINSVHYNPIDPGKILATFFHEGAVYEIDTQSMQAVKVMGGLKNPHGGQKVGSDYLATSTGSGQVFLGNTSKMKVFDFSYLPGKPEALAEVEWLQNSIPYHDFILTIDSNRNAFILFHPTRKLYDMVSFDKDWAIQDLVSYDPSEAQMQAIRKWAG